MYNICFYFLIFYCYAIFGWIVECITCSIGQKRLVYDRGFLIGPYCPIYGYGAMYMYVFLSKYYNDPITLFIMAVVGTSTLEYITSYLMEKLFKARWWDYSKDKINLNGRICLRNAIAFGILGLLFTYIINPAFLSVIERIPENILIVVTVIIFISFLIDNILTFSIMNSLKNKFTNLKQDSTSDIDKQVREILSHYTFYINKLLRSFPKMQIPFPFGEQLMDVIKNTLDSMNKAKKERKRKLKELKKELKMKNKK